MQLKPGKLMILPQIESESEIKINGEYKNLNFLTYDLRHRVVAQSDNSQGRQRGYEESHKIQSLLRWVLRVRSGLIQQEFLMMHTWLGYVPTTRCHPSRYSLQKVCFCTLSVNR